MSEPLKDVVFITKPNDSDLQYIQSWRENKYRGDAESAYKRNNLFVMRYQDKAIAYLCYRRDKIIVTIDLAEVHPKFRNKQVGGCMLENALQQFKKTRIKIAELHCTSEGSLNHAAQHGFTPIKKESDRRDWMFRPLVDIRKPCKKSKLMFAVWKNSIGSFGKEPDVCWALDQDLQYPIIDYCYDDWTVGVIENGIVVKENVFKRFFKGIDYDYIFIMGNELSN